MDNDRLGGLIDPRDDAGHGIPVVSSKRSDGCGTRQKPYLQPTCERKTSQADDPSGQHVSREVHSACYAGPANQDDIEGEPYTRARPRQRP
ncbi:hypothetical protein D3C87_1558700 [compost metagenome]